MRNDVLMQAHSAFGIQHSAFNIQHYSTNSINPFKYAPSGWKMLMGWSAGCESWSTILTLRLASIAAAVTMLWKVALSTACEQLKVNSSPPLAMRLMASALMNL